MRLTDTVIKATAFNNAGVACFKAGDSKKAWELFKGALEIKLAIARFTESKEPPAAEPLYADLADGNRYVARAEILLGAFYTLPHQGQAYPVDPNAEIDPTPTLCRNSIEEELEDFFYTPFLFAKPFPIPDQGIVCPVERSRYTSAVVIFNIALVEHLYNRSSRQAVSLYELATFLMRGDIAGPLALALINNIGVWCYENDHIESAQRCLDQLSIILQNPNVARLMDGQDHRAAMRNVLCLMTPRGSASPAA